MTAILNKTVTLLWRGLDTSYRMKPTKYFMKKTQFFKLFTYSQILATKN